MNVSKCIYAIYWFELGLRMVTLWIWIYVKMSTTYIITVAAGNVATLVYCNERIRSKICIYVRFVQNRTYIFNHISANQPQSDVIQFKPGCQFWNYAQVELYIYCLGSMPVPRNGCLIAEALKTNAERGWISSAPVLVTALIKLQWAYCFNK